jgi:hypothetical protein
VYVHNPAMKPEVLRKLKPVWTGLYRIKKSIGQFNFCVEDTRGNETLIHINRLKLANDPGFWRPKREAPRPCRRPRRQPEEEAVEEPIITYRGPILVPGTRVENSISPVRDPPNGWRTPDGEQLVRETPGPKLRPPRTHLVRGANWGQTGRNHP